MSDIFSFPLFSLLYQFLSILAITAVKSHKYNISLSNIEYQQEDNTHYTAKVKFTSNTQEVFKNTAIRYRFIVNGKIKDKGRKKTDENGLISISLPDLKPTAARSIEVEFDDPQYIYKKTFYLPAFTNDFDVTFFPEGGALLAVQHQNIAFKAQGADGFSKEIEGFLLDSQGDTLTSFHSEHKGNETVCADHAGYLQL